MIDFDEFKSSEIGEQKRLTSVSWCIWAIFARIAEKKTKKLTVSSYGCFLGNNQRRVSCLGRRIWLKHLEDIYRRGQHFSKSRSN